MPLPPKPPPRPLAPPPLPQLPGLEDVPRGEGTTIRPSGAALADVDAQMIRSAFDDPAPGREPATEPNRYAAIADFEALAARVASLEGLTNRTSGEVIEAHRIAKRSAMGLEMLTTDVAERLDDISIQQHLTKHAVKGIEQNRELIAQYQQDTNAQLVAMHNKTRAKVRLVNIGKLLLYFALAAIASHLLQLVTFAAHLFGHG